MSQGPFTSSGGRQNDLWTISGARDARTGLGYGTLDPKTQLPRQLGTEFPYYEKEDSLDDEELDDETATASSKKYKSYRPSDFLRAAGSQPFYFAGGNTKLSDCFWRTDEVLQEVATFADSMSPTPDLYKKPGPGLGATGPSFPYQGGGGSNYRRKGTTHGWFDPPQLTVPMANRKEEQDQEDEILTLQDLADKILKSQGESL